MTPTGAVLDRQTVLVRGDRIVAIGGIDEVSIPRGALRIDGAGQYLLPGLADMHVHLEYFDDPVVLSLFLANGITTIRNMDGRPYILEWAGRVRDGSLIGPTIYTAGPLLDGDPPFRPDNTIVRDAAEARTMVTEQDSVGYDFVKVYTNLSREAYLGVLNTAHELDLPVAGHLPRAVSLSETLESGHRSIEHLGDYAESIEAMDSPLRDGWHWSKRFLGMPVDHERIRDVAMRQASTGIWTVPTLVQADREVAPLASIHEWLEDPAMKHIGDDGRGLWTDQLERVTARLDPADWIFLDRGRTNRLALVSELARAGVPILAGTDTPNPFVIPGFSLHQELGALVEAGLHPRTALTSATYEAARFFDETDEWGTVDVGKRADLQLVAMNPLTDVAHVARPLGVMVRGRWFSHTSLDSLLAAATPISR